MPTSLESSRPIMVPSIRNSVRFSTYSTTPTMQTSDSATAEIVDIEKGLERMENKALIQQRVALTEEKHERMSKLALGAKLERALDRRMASQDAELRPKRKATVTVATDAGKTEVSKEKA